MLSALTEVEAAVMSLREQWPRNGPKKIPGEPFIIVKNLVGAGGATALNFVYERAKPDGLTVFWDGIHWMYWEKEKGYALSRKISA